MVSKKKVINLSLFSFLCVALLHAGAAKAMYLDRVQKALKDAQEFKEKIIKVQDDTLEKALALQGKVLHYAEKKAYQKKMSKDERAWIDNIKKEADLFMRFLDNPHKDAPMTPAEQNAYNVAESLKVLVNITPGERIQFIQSTLIFMEKMYGAVKYINMAMESEKK